MISDILRKIEWSSEWCGNYYCPICKRNKEDGHTDECELKRFIVDADTSDSPEGTVIMCPICTRGINITSQGTAHDDVRITGHCTKCNAITDVVVSPERLRKEQKIVRPPLGVKPKWLHDEERARELRDAINIRLHCDSDIPIEWVEELNSIFVLLKDRKKRRLIGKN